MKILILTEDNSKMEEMEKIGVLNKNLFLVGCKTIRQSSFFDWLSYDYDRHFIQEDNKCPYLFEIEKVKNYGELFKSRLIVHRIEVTFDNAYENKKVHDDEEIGYLNLGNNLQKQIAFFKRTSRGELKVVWKTDNHNPNPYCDFLGTLSEAIVETDHCLQVFRVPLPFRHSS